LVVLRGFTGTVVPKDVERMLCGVISVVAEFMVVSEDVESMLPDRPSDGVSVM
jgi:hypothetical protein